jgi:hypothetical protein
MWPNERREEHGPVGNGARYWPVRTQVHRLVAEHRETARFQHDNRCLVFQHLAQHREDRLEVLTR